MNKEFTYIIEKTNIKEVKDAAKYVAKFNIPSMVKGWYNIYPEQKGTTVIIHYYGNPSCEATGMLYNAVKVIDTFLDNIHPDRKARDCYYIIGMNKTVFKGTFMECDKEITKKYLYDNRYRIVHVSEL